MTALKFCGLTNAIDAAAAAHAGATYAGVIFAGGPRLLTPETAALVLAAAGPSVQGVGVFGDQSPTVVAEWMAISGARVAQLHADPTPAHVRAVRRAGVSNVWAVVRVAGEVLPPEAEALADAADALVLDAKVEGRLGGNGVTLPWNALARQLSAWPSRPRLVLAGGLRPSNVADAVAVLLPDVVDVSSGVERAPGVKDHTAMYAFADAVRGVGA